MSAMTSNLNIKIFGRFITVWLSLFLCIILTSLNAWAQELTMSWYSIESLKKEGTYAYSKGIMANGRKFSDELFTCASCDYSLGSFVKITNLADGKNIIVEVTDRTNRRFKGKRIDLSKSAFAKLAPLSKGIIKVSVEKVRLP